MVDVSVGMRFIILKSSQFLNLRRRGIAKKALEINIQDPHILGGHHKKHPPVDLHTEHNLPNINPNTSQILQKPLIPSMR